MPNQKILDRIHPLASASLALLAAACSGDTIDLGERSSGLEAPPSSCPLAGPVQVKNQAELDALAGCEVLDSLFIAPFEGADLSPLAALREVRGSIEIGSLTTAFTDTEPSDLDFQQLFELLEDRWLFSLTGLESLERAGNLSIVGFDVDSLAALANFELLTREGSLQLASCSGIRDLSGLERLAVLQTLEINCDDLESLRGLTLPSVFGNLLLSGPELKDLGNFSASVVSNVSVSGTGLENLDAFASLQNASAVSITDNPELVDLSGLDGLLSVGFLGVSGNAALQQLPDFQGLTTLGTVAVTDNPQLRNFPTFPGVLVSFEGLQGIIELSARDRLAFRPHSIEIRNNPALESVVLGEGFQAAGLVEIASNAALESIAFSNVAAIDLLDIADNPALDRIDLGALATADTLRVSNNPALDLAAFDGVLTFVSELSSGPAPEPAAP